MREHWLSCRGSMLNGSLLRGYAYGVDLDDAWSANRRLRPREPVEADV